MNIKSYFLFFCLLSLITACQTPKTYSPTAESCAEMKTNEDHEFWDVPPVKAYCLALIEEALFQQSLEDNNVPTNTKNN